MTDSGNVRMGLRIKDVAKLLQVSEKTIYRWVKDESIPFYQINHQYRFDRIELDEWIRKTSRRTSEEAQSPASGKGSLLLSEMLERGGIYYRIEGSTPHEIFRNAFRLINVPPSVRKDQAYEAILERENLMTTAMGDGIAFPHARVPITAFRGFELVSLCFLDEPVDFGALDGIPVRTLFFIFTSDTARHLETITRLGYLCKKESFLALLKAQEKRSRIIEALKSAEEQWLPGINSGSR